MWNFMIPANPEVAAALHDVTVNYAIFWLWPLLASVGGALAGSAMTNSRGGQQSPQDLGQMRAEDWQQILQIPEVRDFLKLQQAQALRLDPLQQAVSQGAFQLLPRSMRAGINFGQVPTPQMPTFPQMVPTQFPTAGNPTLTQQPPAQQPPRANRPPREVPERENRRGF